MSTSRNNTQLQWPFPYRECALYNSSVKSQIDRENKIFNRKPPSTQSKYINMFAGLDNSDPLSFTDLKSKTFQSIFTTKMPCKSLKKALNYANYTHTEHDILSGEGRNPVFETYATQVFEEDRPPVFEAEKERKRVRKRQREGVLERGSKKWVVKNIRSVSEWARSVRDKINKSLIKKRGGLLLMNNTISYEPPR